MRAVVFEAPGKVRIDEVPIPVAGPGEVLLRTIVVGMCGTDLSTFRGKNPIVSYPRIPGHEIAAEIVGVGQDVPAQFAPGMHVTLSPYTNCGRCTSCLRGRVNACQFNQTLGNQRDGAMMDYFTAPWQKIYVAAGLSIPELSLVEPLSVGFHAAARGRVTAQDTVAVLGCGVVGLGAIAASAHAGARVIAIDVDDRKLAVARDAGAAETINTKSAAVHDGLLTLTGGSGPDVIVEAVGTPATFRMAVDEVAFAGRVVYIGYAKEPVEYETRLFVLKELDILGSRNALDEFGTVIAALRGGKFPVASIISLVVPPEEMGAALQAWSDDPGAYVKVQVAFT
ncbi:MAG TPA: zinc-binding alcohol dehydrogenase family protein [Bryobacteraceae bacterium]|nr:zinc-binding alcohol dehydrogenase family protein [Bryobacteraceae bacterium]